MEYKLSMNNHYIDTNHAFLQLIPMLVQQGNVITARDMKTMELTPMLISVDKPTHRCYFLVGRNDNIFAKIAETLWMIRGRYDITWLKYYLPRAEDYSDDGTTWRGAYGPRLRNWNGSDKKADQFQWVIDSLLADVYTRQAVISIWDPSEDNRPVTKDRPCNNWLHFYARKDFTDGNLLLHMNIAQRSCDILWGYSGIDTFSWSVLLEMMAFWTGLQIGHIHHFITSLHIYEQHWKRASEIVARNSSQSTGNTVYERFPLLTTAKFGTPFCDLDEKLDYLFDIERNSRIKPDQYEFELAERLEDDFLTACSQMLFAYILWTQQSKYGGVSWRDLGYVINNINHQLDFRLAAIEYFTRKSTDLLKYVDLTNTEKNVLFSIYARI